MSSYASIDPADAGWDLETIEEIPSSPIEILPGFAVRTTPRGFIHVAVVDEARPDRRGDWRIRERKKYDDRTWRREHELDWTTAEGDAYYPAFQFYGGHAVYVFPCQRLLRGQPIIRGWDFGQLHPACVWFQRHPRNGRVWILREFMPENVPVDVFADLVLFLSGQIDASRLTPLGLSWATRVRETAGYPEPPWFQSLEAIPLRFLDYAGPEANDTSDMPDEKSKARTRAEVLALKGIQLQIMGSSPAGRGEIIGQLLHPLSDNLPGLLIDPACPLMAAGFAGGFAFSPPTKGNPSPDEPHKDGYFEHLHDAFGYGAAGYLPLSSKPVERPMLPRIMTGRRAETLPQEFEGIPFHELAGDGGP